MLLLPLLSAPHPALSPVQKDLPQIPSTEITPEPLAFGLGEGMKPTVMGTLDALSYMRGWREQVVPIPCGLDAPLLLVLPLGTTEESGPIILAPAFEIFYVHY